MDSGRCLRPRFCKAAFFGSPLTLQVAYPLRVRNLARGAVPYAEKLFSYSTENSMTGL